LPCWFGVSSCHLPAVMRRHVRMQQHRLFLGPGEQRFQLFAPRRDVTGRRMG